MHVRSGLKDLYYLYFQASQRLLGFPRAHKSFLKLHGYSLDLKNPKTHNHYILRKMLFDRDPLIVETSDKVLVRDYVKRKLGNNEANKVLIPLYHVTKTGGDIPFSELPEEFFMKANHFSGANKLVSKEDDFNEVVLLAREWLRSSYGQGNHEWAYGKIAKRILCEKVLRTSSGKIPQDIKFYFWHGKLKMMLFVEDRFEDMKWFFCDENFREIKGAQVQRVKRASNPEIPQNISEMKALAAKLAEDFDYCRIDLYEIDGHIYFGEVTHYTGGGWWKFSDLKTDCTLGKFWDKENSEKSYFDLYEEFENSEVLALSN